MPTRAFGWVLFGTLLSLPLGLAVGCGQSDGEDVGTAGSATAGSSPSGAGTAGNVGGSATGGKASGGSASGGSASGGSGGGLTTGGRPDAQAGAGNEAGAGAGLVDCDPLMITCKRAAPSCDPGEVPSVDDIGNCYGECVKIDRCACSTAQQCPDPDQYTCWAKQHCGPFVR
jgi:hypothetical protein